MYNNNKKKVTYTHSDIDIKYRTHKNNTKSNKTVETTNTKHKLTGNLVKETDKTY